MFSFLLTDNGIRDYPHKDSDPVAGTAKEDMVAVASSDSTAFVCSPPYYATATVISQVLYSAQTDT